MTLKKITLTIAASFAFASSAFAADASTGARWGVGGAFNNYDEQTVPSAIVIYLNSRFLVQGGLGYDNVKEVDGIKYHTVYTYLNVGLRNMMNNQVSFDYGISGYHAISSSTHTADSSRERAPYAAGTFIGLDFMIVQNVLFLATINPYTYYSDSERAKSNHIFNTGSLSISYMF